MTSSRKTEFIISKLKLLGYNLDITDQYIKVKLPWGCSVNISEKGEFLKAEPRFGFVTRTSATIWTQVITFLVIFLGILFFIDDIKFLYYFGVCVIVMNVWDVQRYILTESFITRFECLVLEMDKESISN